ncbi:MAG TPA: lytic transglycosylase domain-containing protein, partial [Caproiciproducens sp.]|nr:lytic transglycosylase domain-containing protein [Caproiciproducens sp.]
MSNTAIPSNFNITSASTQAEVNQAQSAAVSSGFSGVLKKAVDKTANAQSVDLEDIFRRASEEYNVPENLLKAVAKAESGFDADAVSRCGAQGIMQLMPSTAASLGVQDSFDPEQNIMGGAKYLSWMLDRYNGDAELALAAYNAGSGNVAKYGGVPPFKETRSYVAKVMGYAGMDISAKLTSLNTLATGSSASDQISAAGSMFSNASPSDKLSALSYLMTNLSGGNGTSALNSLFGGTTGDSFFDTRFQSDSYSPLSSLSDTSSTSSPLDSLNALLGNSDTNSGTVTGGVQNGILRGLSGLASGNMSSQQYA